MEPVALAGAAVLGVVVVSLLLVGLFSSREENFEDHVAAHLAEQQATIAARSSAPKNAKTKKKFPKSKKKHSELDKNDEGLGKHGRESVDDEEGGKSGGKKTESGDDKPKSILKEQKKKGKKQRIVKEESPSLIERRAHFADEPVVEEVLEQPALSMDVEAAPPPAPVPEVEAKPIIVEEIMPVSQPPTNAEPPAPKKSKKQKAPKEKSSGSGDSTVQRLRESIKSANLSAAEQQDLIDMLLNEKGSADQWKSASKGDLTDVLKKQIQEKEMQVMEEQRQALSTANKLKELRDEVQQERLKQKNQLTAATNKITAQSKELQAMQARMKASHDGHTTEVQTLQTQLRHFTDAMNSVTMENAQLKNASMRASQLNADKESLTGELNKLQQSHRLLKADLAARVDQLTQVDGHRQMLEKQLSEMSGSQVNQDAENALSKRLAEVNEELKKADAKNASLANQLSTAKETLAEKESNCKGLEQQLANVESKNVSPDSMNALTAKLTEATDRVTELQNMFTSVEEQLKKSQESITQKDHQIGELESQLKVAHETPVQNHVANHVDHKEEKSTVSLQIHNDLLQEKDDAITKMKDELTQRDEEIINVKNLVDQEKRKNNDLRMKNWKAMEAISTVEQNSQSQITKAVQAAKEEAKKEILSNSSIIKEKDQSLTKLQEELDSQKQEFKKLEEVVDQQKKKNNDLREKNWKAMDAIAVAERSVGEQVKKAVQSVKDDNKTSVENERTSTKNFLCTLHPDVTIDSSLSYDKWLAEYQNNVSSKSSVNNQGEDLLLQLEESKKELEQNRAECNHYKNGLEETEAMLRKLENQIETEIRTWEGKLTKTEQELNSANSRISSLENDLVQAKSAREAHVVKLKELESKFEQTKELESQARAKITSLEDSVSKLGTGEELQEKLAKLEKELLESRENEKKSSEASSKLASLEKDLSSSRQELGSKDKDLSSTVQQLSEVEGKLLTRESEVKSLRDELTRVQQSGEEMKKKVASLEGSLGKSQESLDDINVSSPEKSDKKKKGIKGALGLKLGGSSKKHKEEKAEKEKAFEEAQKQVAALKSEVEELKAQNKKLTISLETEMTRSQQIEKDVADAMADGVAKSTAVTTTL